MNRYIDVEAFREEMDNHYPFDKHTQDHYPILNYAKSRIIKLLATFPSADVVEVVRCKDCKYSQFKDNGVLRPIAYCHKLNVIISGKGKGYCYLAERKDGEKE